MRFLLLVSLLCVFGCVLGQSDSTQTGKIPSGEIIIEKEKQLSLPAQTKPFINLPFRNFNANPLEVTFPRYSSELTWPEYQEFVPIRQPERYYEPYGFQNYVKAGYGNYSSPMIEAGLYHTFDDIYVGSKVFYERFGSGPINDDNSASARGSLDIEADIPVRGVKVLPYIQADFYRYKFYGNTFGSEIYPEESLNKIGFNSFTMGSKVKDEKQEYRYAVGAEVNLSGQSESGGATINKENGFYLGGELEYPLIDDFETGLSLDFYHTSYDGVGLKYNRSLFALAPTIGKKQDTFSWDAGFQIATGSSNNQNSTGFYPKVRATWLLHNNWEVAAFFDSEMEWVNLASLIAQNQFLDDSLVIMNQEKNWSVGASAQRTFGEVEVNVEAAYSGYSNMPLFVPSFNDSSRYTLTYDDDLKNLHIIVGLTYHSGIYNQYSARILFNNYTPSEQEEAWHLPSYELRLNSNHIIRESFVVDAYFILMGGIKAPNLSESSTITLSPLADLGLSLSYLINQRASVFISADNVFGAQYERYIGYPVRGLSFKFGGKYRF